MKIVKPHFWYNKSQRNGVLFLLLLIVLLQILSSFVDFSNNEKPLPDTQVQRLQSQIDSLKKIEIEKRKPKTYPFNPSYITDYKGAQLGMSIEEIDRLLVFRKQNKFINSASQFQKVTKISDSLLDAISPYFKFPDWIVHQNKTKNSARINSKQTVIRISTSNLNTATIQDLQSINGVNVFLAQRIIKYRKRIKGFTFKSQLLEVWKLEKETASDIFSVFSIKEKPVIEKMNVNTASFKEVLSIPYINYDLCKKIFQFKDEVAELQSIEELKNIEGFPEDKFDRIVLYLEAK
ncbi:MAG: DNA uptake protein ComE-like DNA-binding protein [Polaribacter sp.]|jgi:DNA uptake protein ComE-like DNA-binding protein